MVHFIPAGAKLLVEESNQQGKAVYEFATREEIIDTLLTRSKSVAVANAALRRIEARRKASVACARSGIPAVLSNDAIITKQARESRQAFLKWLRKNDSRFRERMQRQRREKDDTEALEWALRDAETARQAAAGRDELSKLGKQSSGTGASICGCPLFVII